MTAMAANARYFARGNPDGAPPVLGPALGPVLGIAFGWLVADMLLPQVAYAWRRFLAALRCSHA